MTLSAKRRETPPPPVAAATTETLDRSNGIAVHTPRASVEEEEADYLCPGPEWPPETTTCGRMLSHPGRCLECTKLRTQLRKADRRTGPEPTEETEPYVLALPAL